MTVDVDPLPFFDEPWPFDPSFIVTVGRGAIGPVAEARHCLLQQLPFSISRREGDPIKEEIGLDSYELRRAFRFDRCRFIRTHTLATLRKGRKAQSSPRMTLDAGRFMDLPLEIILEIFDFLHPLDLMHLSHTNHPFRTLLTSPRSLDTVWKQSFRHTTAPACPAEMSGRNYAFLLYGPARCSICGFGPTYQDFNLRRRLCTSCMNRVLSHINEEDEPLVNLLPLCLRISGYDTSSYDYHFRLTFGRVLTKDRKAVQHQLRIMSHEIAMGLPDAEERLEQYKADLTAKVAAGKEHALELEHWGRMVVNSVWSEQRKLETLLEMRYTKRLVRLGHSVEDISMSGIYWMIQDMDYPRFSKQMFRHMLPFMERKIQEAKNNRLRYEENRRRIRRVRPLYEAYQSLKCQLPATEWIHWPHIGQMTLWRESQVLTSAKEEDISMISFAQHLKLDDLRQNVGKWRVSCKDALRNLIPNLATMTLYAKDKDPVDLATTIFYCRPWKRYPVLFGPGDVMAHLQHCSIDHEDTNGTDDNMLNFDKLCSRTAASLVELVGLEPQTTTLQEMDIVCEKLRFFCSRCTLPNRNAWTWRECVDHAQWPTHRQAPEAEASWELISPLVTANILARERRDTTWMDPSWTCNHCDVYFDQQEQRRSVVNHLRASHKVFKPLEGVDFVYFRDPMGQRTSRRPISIRATATLQCIHSKCTNPSASRLRTPKQMAQHCFDKHQVLEGREGVHWRVCEVGSRASAPNTSFT